MKRFDLLNLPFVVILILFVRVVAQVFGVEAYGFHRDEFLYLAMGNHLAWGYLEGPPVIALLAKCFAIFNSHTTQLIRLLPALAGVATILLSVKLVQKIGGGRTAQILVAVTIAIDLLFIRTTLLFQPVAFDQLAWVAAAYVFILILKEHQKQYWIVLGLVVGIGLLVKYTILLFVLSIIFGISLTTQRKLFRESGIWYAVAIAFLLFLPNLVWEWKNEWPIIDHLHTLSRTQLTHIAPHEFLLTQFLVNIFAMPIFLFGVFACFRKDYRIESRIFGWAFVALLIVGALLRLKEYYISPIYPVLYSMGVVAVESFATQSKKRWIVKLTVGWVVAVNLFFLPFSIPFLPPAQMEKYGKWIGENTGLWIFMRWESGRIHNLPQDYADMLGWEELAASVRATISKLPDSTKRDLVILASNYGETGALQLYREKYGLPPVIGFNGSFHNWGYGNATGEVLLAVGFDPVDIKSVFERVDTLHTIRHPFARESEIPVLFCYRLKRPISEIWKELKRERF